MQYYNIRRLKELPPLECARQDYLVEKCRCILASWLYEVYIHFQLELVTFHLGVQIVDRVLAKLLIARRQLQLVGIASMHIAAKYHEVHAPKMADWRTICGEYTIKDIQAMERVILRTIDYDLNFITPIEVLLCASKQINVRQIEVDCVTLMMILRGHRETTSECVVSVLQYFGHEIDQIGPFTIRSNIVTHRMGRIQDEIRNIAKSKLACAKLATQITF